MKTTGTLEPTTSVDVQQLLKQKTFKQVEKFAREKGLILTRESECYFRKNGRYTNKYTDTWYTLSSCDQKFPLLIDVVGYLFPLVKQERDIIRKEIEDRNAAIEQAAAAAAAIIRAREKYLPKGAPPPVTDESPWLYKWGAELKNKWKENYNVTGGNALAYTGGYFFKLNARGDIRHYTHGSQIELTPNSLVLRTEKEVWEFKPDQVPGLCPSDEDSAIEVWDAFSACVKFDSTID